MKRSYVLVLRTLLLERPVVSSNGIDRIWTIDGLLSYFVEQYGVDSFTRRSVQHALDRLGDYPVSAGRRVKFVYHDGSRWLVNDREVLLFARSSRADPETGDLWVELLEYYDSRGFSVGKSPVEALGQAFFELTGFRGVLEHGEE